MKVALITNIPNPYRIPLFNKLNSELKARGAELTVIFGSTGYKRRQWKTDLSFISFPHRFLRSKKIRLGSLEKYLFTYDGLLDELKSLDPDVIITNGFSLSTFKILRSSSFKAKKCIIWTGSVETKGRKESFLRKLYRKHLAKKASGFIAYSTLTSRYLQRLGVSPDKISIAINTTDTVFYGSQTDAIREKMSREEKDIRFLFVGHLTPGKRIDLALKALQQLKERKQLFHFDIVGDGIERKNLEALVTKYGLMEQVTFHGFVQKEELPNHLAAADVFLFPSEYDVWGLVVVEAMSAGLVCLSSIYSGVTLDLIKDGQTGFALDFEDTASVVNRMMELISDQKKRKQIGANARKFIEQNVTISNSVSGFLKALNY